MNYNRIVKRFQFSDESKLYVMDDLQLTEDELVKLILLVPDASFSIIGAQTSLREKLAKHKTPENQIVSLVIFNDYSGKKN